LQNSPPEPYHKQSKTLNPVEIEEAISALVEQPFDAVEFPFAFLEAFGNKPTTIKRLRKGESNKSDLGGVLQTSNNRLGASLPNAAGLPYRNRDLSGSNHCWESGASMLRH
jgi:hypothetical protein